ncbi:MAG: 3-hydroxyacyl-CoA dehydrogenase, partial [Rhodobacterales bacterium 34-62-10]
RAMIEAGVKEFGRIDAVVNNAGILRDGFFHKMTHEDFDAVVKVHLYGAFNTSRAAADYFREQEGGALVHMTSTSGLIGNLAQANYASAKLGIAALSKSIALDLKRWNVRSNCIAPFAWSRMISSIKTDTPEQVARVEKIKQMTPAKVAPMACFLMSDRAADVSGQVFAVRKNEIFLFNQPRPVRSVHSGEGWTADEIAERAMPTLRSQFTPLEVSADVFSWDPV